MQKYDLSYSWWLLFTTSYSCSWDSSYSSNPGLKGSDCLTKWVHIQARSPFEWVCHCGSGKCDTLSQVWKVLYHDSQWNVEATAHLSYGCGLYYKCVVQTPEEYVLPTAGHLTVWTGSSWQEEIEIQIEHKQQQVLWQVALPRVQNPGPVKLNQKDCVSRRATPGYIILRELMLWTKLSTSLHAC